MLNSFDVTWIVILGVFLLAGIVKGVVGMGLPTVAMGLLAITMPPPDAAAILLVPSFATNVWQLLAGPSFFGLCKRLWTMMVGIVIGTVSGAGLIAGAHSTGALAALGVALTLYAALGLRSKKFVVRPTHEPWLSPLIGVVTGLITGATGVFVIPAVPYLQALQLERNDLIQALGLSFTVSTVALAGGLFGQGVFEASTSLLGLSLLALVPALLGMFAGQHLRERMSVETFRRVFFIGLLLLGLYLTFKGLS
ncbi:sulfite exporter TauE/SafE family protein [Bradyrhizobium sp.]|uniref:sulfite exporter TauE/SafE family protein n=1 Tax=Bradyrhizobium sp. TaxID=376 RepID=UPI002E0C7582|nr:sulfite exporter TauE/SafE family protein [Bradyrhizobium sp.]